MLNRIDIMGRLVRDPELRHTQSGTSVCSFTVAVDRDYQGKDSDSKQTDFIDCVAWRQTGEFITKYFAKGRMIVVSGSLLSRHWEDKEGKKRTSWEVVANSVYFGDSKRDAAADAESAYSNGIPEGYEPPADGVSYPASNGFSELGEEDGELPF